MLISPLLMRFLLRKAEVPLILEIFTHSHTPGRYVDYVLELRHKKTHHSKVHYLQLLSGPLHWELQREIHSKILNIHPVPLDECICEKLREGVGLVFVWIGFFLKRKMKHPTVIIFVIITIEVLGVFFLEVFAFTFFSF